MRLERVRQQPVLRYRRTAVQAAEDHLVVEEPLEIRVNGISLAVVMRTPGDDRELASGFLFTEQIVADSSDIVRVVAGVDELGLPAENCIDMRLRKPLDPRKEGWQRSFYAASSCGVCGKRTIAALRSRCAPVDGQLRISASILASFHRRLLATQSLFSQTGGLHAAALFSVSGEPVVVREDIGRHNAVDKVIGWALLHDRLPLDDTVLVVSGRTSFEIVQKAWVGGVPVVAGVSAASSLAVDLAQEAGMTLIGFLREDRMSVYCGPERVV